MNFYVTEDEMDSYAEFVRSLMKQTNIHELDVIHATALGIVAEYFEIIELKEELEQTISVSETRRLNALLLKEHGDMLFYFRAAFNLLTITNSRIFYNIEVGPPSTYVKWHKGLEELLDHTKRRFIYEQQRVPLEQTIIDLWYTFCDELHEDFGEEYLRACLVENEAKLRKRYPHGFSTQDSIIKRDVL